MPAFAIHLAALTLLTVADLDPLDLAIESIEVLRKHATQLIEKQLVCRGVQVNVAQLDDVYSMLESTLLSGYCRCDIAQQAPHSMHAHNSGLAATAIPEKGHQSNT